MVLKTPLVVASGPGGMGEYMPFINPYAIGAYIFKTITLHPKEGSLPPRLHATEHFLINRIGLENQGIDSLIENLKAGRYDNILNTVPVILSLGGDSPKEYIEIAKKVRSIADIFIAIEFNFSCPNVEMGGLTIVADRQQLKETMYRIRGILKSSFIIAKFGIEGIFVEDAADITKDAGWDGITLINTIRGLVKTDRGYLRGGLSGPILKPIGMRAIYEVRKRHKDMFIMASGGIYTYNDVVDYLEAGSDVVQIGSALFKNPTVINDIYLKLSMRENYKKNERE